MGVSHSYKVPYSGVGYVYFIHPNGFPSDIQFIKDPNGFTLYDSGAPTYSAFTHSNISLTGLNAGSYKVWRTTATSSYVGVGQFEFIF
jgi:hypothetical protein